MKQVVIIGVGNLGFRHLQSVLNSKNDIRVSVIDKDTKALDRSRIEMENCDSKNITIGCVSKNMKDLDDELDVVIVATTSNSRASIIKKLLEIASVKYLILEKVLFTSLEDYDEISNILQKKRIFAYVNCPRRMYKAYIDLKCLLKNDNLKFVNITGGNLGIGCNSIHFIDLLGFLNSSKNSLSMSSNGLDYDIIKSKRDGYIEFTGFISGELDNCRFVINSSNNYMGNIIITIITENRTIVIDETLKVMKIVENDNVELIDFDIPFQSQLTSYIVDELLNDGVCKLTSYEESKKYHLELLKILISHQNKNGIEEKSICMIS